MAIFHFLSEERLGVVIFLKGFKSSLVRLMGVIHQN